MATAGQHLPFSCECIEKTKKRNCDTQFIALDIDPDLVNQISQSVFYWTVIQSGLEDLNEFKDPE